MNPRRFHGGSRNEDVAHVACVPLDFDTEAKAVEGFRRLELAGLVPSIVVASGRPGARHAHFLLDKPYDPVVARQVAPRLTRWTISDRTSAAQRLMRLPGTINHRSGARAEILVFEPGRRYSLDETARALDAVGAPRLHEPRPRDDDDDHDRRPLPRGRRARPAPRQPTSRLSQADVDALPIEVRARLRALVNGMSPRVRGLLTDPDPTRRSEDEMAILRSLVERGASDDEARLVLRWAAWERLAEKPDSVERTLAAVHEIAAPTAARVRVVLVDVRHASRLPTRATPA